MPNIDPLKTCLELKVLGLFHNEIFNESRTMDILENHLLKLEELSIEANPCSSNIKFKYDCILRIENLHTLDEEKVVELDRSCAELYFKENKVPLP